MAIEYKATYICDVCEKQVEVDGDDYGNADRPDGWVTASIDISAGEKVAYKKTALVCSPACSKKFLQDSHDAVKTLVK